MESVSAAPPRVPKDDKTCSSRNSNRKRKADVLGRVGQSTRTQGRGAEAGWTTCPLCVTISKKRYALGRGIAAHLHAVHTPWKPGKLEQRKRRRIFARQQREQQRDRKSKSGAGQFETSPSPTAWEPSTEEIEAWDQKVLEIVSHLEQDVEVEVGIDRAGKAASTYRESIPPFLLHASNGDMESLRSAVDATRSDEALSELIHTKDRNGSTAEHWAAGGGSVECLRYLLELNGRHPSKTSTDKRIRRRDGKTSLHYAARNGRLKCIRYLLDHGHRVDETSGDGTTPLHLAIYGGHLAAVQLLLDKGADIAKKNDWGCGSSHWLGMTKASKVEDVIGLCKLLKLKSVCFAERQSQGHSILHKAAKTQNSTVLEWVAREGLNRDNKQNWEEAGAADQGGHRPSDIWLSVGGDPGFGDWLRNDCSW